MPRCSQVATTTGPMLPDCETRLTLASGGLITMKPVMNRSRSLETRPTQLGPMRVMLGLRGDARELALHLRALLAGLGEAGGDDDHGARVTAGAGLEHADHVAAADHHEDEVRLLGQVVDARVGREAEELRGPRVHRVDAPGVAAAA